MSTRWKRRLLEHAADAFGKIDEGTKEGPTIAELHAKIGELPRENDICACAGCTERKEMIDRSHPLPITTQAHLLNLSGSNVYYRPVGVSERDLALMSAIDKIHLEFPFYESCRMRGELKDRGFSVGREQGSPLMRQMGTPLLFPEKKLSKSTPGPKIYPYSSATGRSPERAQSGAPMSPISPWPGDFAISRASWTPRPAGAFLLRFQHSGGLVLHRGSGRSPGALPALWA